jgi:predicted aspartyl protease
MNHLLMWAAALASPAVAQDALPPSDASTHPAETIATGEDANSRLTVPVMVNGQGPFRFIVDTGADRSVISAELAARLSLPVDEKVRLVSMGGVSTVNTVRLKSLAVTANRSIKNVVLPALPERYLGADGLVGLDALKGQRVMLDFAAQTIIVEPGNTRAVRDEPVTGNMIVVRARSRMGQLVLVDADANGQDVWVIVDTGGQNTVANGAMKNLMIKRTPPEGFKQITLMSVVGERIPAEYTVIGKMRIGGVQMGNAAVAFADAQPFRKFGLVRKPAMLLGMEGLRSFKRVSIDFANKEVRFVMPEGVPVGASR